MFNILSDQSVTRTKYEAQGIINFVLTQHLCCIAVSMYSAFNSSGTFDAAFLLVFCCVYLVCSWLLDCSWCCRCGEGICCTLVP